MWRVAFVNKVAAKNGSFGVRNEQECVFYHLSGFTSTLCQIISPVLFFRAQIRTEICCKPKNGKSTVLQKINISLCMNMAVARYFFCVVLI